MLDIALPAEFSYLNVSVASGNQTAIKNYMAYKRDKARCAVLKDTGAIFYANVDDRVDFS